MRKLGTLLILVCLCACRTGRLGYIKPLPGSSQCGITGAYFETGFSPTDRFTWSDHPHLIEPIEPPRPHAIEWPWSDAVGIALHKFKLGTILCENVIDGPCIQIPTYGIAGPPGAVGPDGPTGPATGVPSGPISVPREWPWTEGVGLVMHHFPPGTVLCEDVPYPAHRECITVPDY